MTRLRVINLGLPKTGTTTLSRALRRAGLNVADWRIRAEQTQNKDLIRALVGKLVYRGYFDTGDPLALLDEFDAVTEMSFVKFDFTAWPQTDWAIIDAIMTHHPGARFLLSYRDPAETAASMKGWGNLGEKRLPATSVPGLPKGFGHREDELARWIEGHYRFCRHVLAGSDRLLEYDITDPEAPQKIGAFLGRDLPWWGRANKNRDPQLEDVK
ncbi:MAG: sulfotransferase [Paracoccaceae bacterium]